MPAWSARSTVLVPTTAERAPDDSHRGNWTTPGCVLPEECPFALNANAATSAASIIAWSTTEVWMVARLLGKPRQRDGQRGQGARCAVGVDRVKHVLQFDLHLDPGVFCLARCV